MNVEIGKTYVLDDGRVARCVARLVRPVTGDLMVLVVTGSNGDEGTTCCTPEGDYSYKRGKKVIKEYTPPLKVRLVVHRSASGVVNTWTAVEGTVAFADKDWPGVYSTGHYGRLVGDQVVEVPQS
jgi:hypothetical protein